MLREGKKDDKMTRNTRDREVNRMFLTAAAGIVFVLLLVIIFN